MKALSIQQPWAWLIARGYKDIENRSWFTRYRGRFLIHASQKADYHAIQKHRLAGVIKSIMKANNVTMDDLERGGIVGAVDLVDCITAGGSQWFDGDYGFVLANPEVMKFVPCRGKLNFFSVESVEQPKVLHDMEYK